MTSKKLSRFDNIDKDTLENLKNNKIFTCKDVLSKDIIGLLNACGSYETAKSVLLTVSNVVAPRPSTVMNIYSKGQQSFLPTSLQKLDKALHGGLATGTITELTGPPGCGKTQFCMMLSSITVASDTHQNSVVFIDTENAFTGKRFLEILKTKNVHSNINDVASRVIVYKESSSKALMCRLENLEEAIISKNVKLIILDSIASLARKEFGQVSLIERNQLLMKQATLLKYFAENFNIPVLVTNQISTRFHVDFTLDTSMTAALGNTWAHAVNTRLMVEFTDADVRKLTIAKSPISPVMSFDYVVDTGGIRLVENV